MSIFSQFTWRLLAVQRICFITLKMLCKFIAFLNSTYCTEPGLNFIILRKAAHKHGDKSRGNYNNLLAITWARSAYHALNSIMHEARQSSVAPNRLSNYGKQHKRFIPTSGHGYRTLHLEICLHKYIITRPLVYLWRNAGNSTPPASQWPRSIYLAAPVPRSRADGGLVLVNSISASSTIL